MNVTRRDIHFQVISNFQSTNSSVHDHGYGITAAQFVPSFIYNIGTTVLNGGVSMVIFFVVNKIIFPQE